MNPPLSVTLAPSRYLRGYLLLLHSAAAVAVFILMPMPWLLGAIIAVAVSLFISLRRYAHTASPYWVEAAEYSNQRWSLRTPSGAIDVELRQATVWQWLVIMNFYAESQRRYYAVVVLPESATRDERRQLRVLLRHVVGVGVNR